MARKKLKILIIAPTNFKVTDQNAINSGSIEQHTYLLSEALAKRGHKVTLFATKDAGCPPGVKLAYVFKSTPRNYYKVDPNLILAKNFIQATTALEKASKYDYVSCHTMAGIAVIELLKSQGIKITGSTTIHWRSEDSRLAPLLARYPEHPLIVSSRHANKFLRSKNNILGIIHPGLKLDQWPYSSKKKNYLLFVGKIIPEKGVDLVIQAAKYLNIPLIIAGRRMDERFPTFFSEKVEPYLDKNIKYIGEVSGPQKIDLFREAMAFISPGRWEEPFGIVFIEAQACGTPVIAWNPGSSNDPIIKGKTGFVIKAKNDKQAIRNIIKAIKKIETLKAKDCRDNIINKYLITKTAEDYEKIIYKQIKSTILP